MVYFSDWKSSDEGAPILIVSVVGTVPYDAANSETMIAKMRSVQNQPVRFVELLRYVYKPAFRQVRIASRATL